MPPLAEAFVRLRPDTSTFEPEAKKEIGKAGPGIAKAGEKIGRQVGDRTGKQIGTRIGVGMHGPIAGAISRSAGLFAAGFAAIKVGGFLKGAITEASDLGETVSKTQQIFGKSSGAVVAFGKNAATSLGQSQNQALTAAANFGNLFNNLGLTQKASAGMSTQLVKTATDLASFNNASPQEMLEGIQSALAGEFDPLQRYGLAINAAAVQHEVMRQGLAKTTKDITPAMTAQAAYSLILQQTGKASGDFARTSGGLANQQRILSAQFTNFKASIGAIALPLITKLFTFLTGTGLPALRKVGDAFKLVLGDDGAQGFGEVMDNAFGNTGKFVGFFRTVGDGIRQLVFGFRALVAAFRDGDVTSDGFVGAMERIGVQARHAFDFFKTDVLPILKALAGLIVGTLIPAFIDFGGWLVRNRSWLLPIASGILAIVAAIKIVTTAIKVWQAVTKAFAVVQLAFNLIMLANPVALIALAIIGLIAALVTAYKTSDKFRAIVDAAFRFVKAAAVAVFNWIKSNWPLLLAILTGPIGAAVILIVRNWDRIKSTASAMWAGIKNVFRDGVRIVVGVFFGMVGAVIDGAAKAFGWVPKLGDKLKKAAADFRKFRDDTNAALGGVKSRKITVSATLTAGAGPIRGSGVFARATGGPIFGAGSATSDSIPAMLSNGEHVLTAKEVKAFGGHSAVMAMRQEVVRGFASGGPVGFDIDARLTGLAKFQRVVDDFNKRVDTAARKMALTGPFSANLAGVVNFARAQAGKPYGWGSAGPGSFDCSGFVSNLVEVAKGMPLYRRLFATGSMAGYPWTNHFGGAFKVGWTTNAGGGIGHTAATVNGVNMESRGGDGVVVGAGSRGANQGIFNRHAFLARGGPVLPGDPPFDILDPRGRHFRPGLLEALKDVRRFDTGGWLPPRSATVAVNGTNQWEPVGQPGIDYDRLAGAMVRALDRSSLPERTGREVHRNFAKGTRA